MSTNPAGNSGTFSLFSVSWRYRTRMAKNNRSKVMNLGFYILWVSRVAVRYCSKVFETSPGRSIIYLIWYMGIITVALIFSFQIFSTACTVPPILKVMLSVSGWVVFLIWTVNVLFSIYAILIFLVGAFSCRYEASASWGCSTFTNFIERNNSLLEGK